MISDQNLTQVRDAVAGFAAGSIDKFVEIFGEEGVLIEAQSLPYGGTYQGKENIKAAMLSIGDYWKEMSIDYDYLANDRYVITYGTLFATAIETDIKTSFPLAEVWEFDGNRLISMKPLYFDTAAALATLGLVRCDPVEK